MEAEAKQEKLETMQEEKPQGVENVISVEEEDEELEEEGRLPFPNARVVNIMRAKFQHQHQLKKEVKIAANELLGRILEDIAEQLDAQPYSVLSIGHFKDAARKYLEIELTEKRIIKYKKRLEAQRAELDEMIEQIEVEHGKKSITPGQHYEEASKPPASPIN